MPQVIKIPHLNHLHFHRYPSESFAPDVIPSFEEDRIYLQKFVRNVDEIYFQVHVLPDFVTSIGFYLEGVDGTTLPLTGSSVGNLNGYDIWHIYSDNFWTLPAGVYFVVLEVTINMGGGDIIKKYVSEPVKMVNSLPESLLIEYSHGRNEFDFAFYPDGTPESKKSYFLRVEGGVMSDGFNPGSKDSYFVDQDREVLLLDSRPYNVYEFTFGPGSGLPNWMADKINRILSLSDIKINNQAYVKNEGSKLEPVRDKGYPLAGWKIEMVKSETDDAIIEAEDEAEPVSLGYGLIYNKYALSGLAPSGWHVMTANEFTALAEFVGWYDYESYIADATKLIPDGEYGLNLMNGGHRGSDGAFSESTVFHLIDNDFGYTAMNFFNSSEVWVIQKDMSYLNKDGLYVILVKDSTSLADGETSSITDVDGNIIPTICIDGVEFTSQNWKSTKLADGTPIPEVTDNSAWAALITGALCAYDNDLDNV